MFILFSLPVSLVWSGNSCPGSLKESLILELLEGDKSIENIPQQFIKAAKEHDSAYSHSSFGDISGVISHVVSRNLFVEHLKENNGVFIEMDQGNVEEVLSLIHI